MKQEERNSSLCLNGHTLFSEDMKENGKKIAKEYIKSSIKSELVKKTLSYFIDHCPERGFSIEIITNTFPAIYNLDGNHINITKNKVLAKELLETPQLDEGFSCVSSIWGYSIKWYPYQNNFKSGVILEMQPEVSWLKFMDEALFEEINSIEL